jgi:NAD(P)-dependent dehydrogenase (short-subunit alcohol dehydrogenase family)
VPAAERAFGRLDILCNVAGLTDRGSILDTGLDLFDRMFAVNVRAPFFLMQDAIRLMRRQDTGGAIANVLSVNAYVGSPELSPYSASKGALLTLTRNTAHAVNADRIRVNGLALGWADTPGEHETLEKFHGARPGWLEAAEARQPFGRLIKPADVARALCFLVGPQSLPMTGTIMDFSQTVIGAGGGAPSAYPAGGAVRRG